MSTVVPSMATEWLETDGLGGFSSGTTASVNTRRYHALLLAAEHPPSDRRVLPNDIAVWLQMPRGVKHLSRHDGNAPHLPGSCFLQAWSLAELLRVEIDVLGDRAARENSPRRTA